MSGGRGTALARRGASPGQETRPQTALTSSHVTHSGRVAGTRAKQRGGGRPGKSQKPGDQKGFRLTAGARAEWAAGDGQRSRPAAHVPLSRTAERVRSLGCLPRTAGRTAGQRTPRSCDSLPTCITSGREASPPGPRVLLWAGFDVGQDFIRKRERGSPGGLHGGKGVVRRSLGGAQRAAPCGGEVPASRGGLVQRPPARASAPSDVGGAGGWAKGPGGYREFSVKEAER